MKKKHLIIIVLLAMIFNSCSEIIDIGINASDAQLVVEAKMPQDGTARVILTRSINFYDSLQIPAVTTATVVIRDDAGNSETLNMSSPGIYESVTMTGKPGRKYFLTIHTEDEHITSESLIPARVPMDSVYAVNSIYPGGGPPVFPGQSADFFEVYVKYTDPLTEQNFYRIILYINGKESPRLYVYDDRLTNGNQVENLHVVYDPDLKDGDKIVVEMQCIDKKVYEYYKSMGNSSMGPRNTTSPANPYSNLQGAILGYFSAHTVERKEITLVRFKP
jgi:hypothetical protein